MQRRQFVSYGFLFLLPSEQWPRSPFPTSFMWGMRVKGWKYDGMKSNVPTSTENTYLSPKDCLHNIDLALERTPLLLSLAFSCSLLLSVCKSEKAWTIAHEKSNIMCRRKHISRKNEHRWSEIDLEMQCHYNAVVMLVLFLWVILKFSTTKSEASFTAKVDLIKE